MKEENQKISKWFRSKGLFFQSTVPRTDYYYALVDTTKVGLKLREGRIEYKHKVGEDSEQTLFGNAVGIYENWIKWSFTVQGDDTEQTDILKYNKNGLWIKTYKERVGIKVYNNERNESVIVNLGEQIDPGCQIEYTRLIINDEQWFTFGLEYFGNRLVKPDENILKDIIGSAELKKEDSMSYPEFFRKKNGFQNLKSLDNSDLILI